MFTLEFLWPIILWLTSGFVVGFVVGWTVSQKTDSSAKRVITNGMAVAIGLVWIISVMVAMMTDYTTPIAVHAIMGAIVGYLLPSEEGSVIDKFR